MTPAEFYQSTLEDFKPKMEEFITGCLRDTKIVPCILFVHTVQKPDQLTTHHIDFSDMIDLPHSKLFKVILPMKMLKMQVETNAHIIGCTLISEVWYQEFKTDTTDREAAYKKAMKEKETLSKKEGVQILIEIGDLIAQRNYALDRPNIIPIGRWEDMNVIDERSRALVYRNFKKLTEIFRNKKI